MDLAQYDKWVIGNQKRILDWTKMHSKERFAPIRDAFTAYHRAKSNKQKIQAFENLKKELVSGKGVKFNDLVNNTFEPTKSYLQGAADKFTKGDIDALDRNSNLSEKLKVYDDLAPLSEAMKSIPEKVKGFDWVELDKAFRDNYSYDEMKALADKYNFDYKDPKERKEFIELLADMEQKRLKQDAYTPHDGVEMLTQVAYPVTLEHARKTDEFSPKAMAFDLASQAAMAGGEGVGNMLAGKAGSVAGGMLTAPAITEAGQYLVNNKPAEDALADYAVGVGTNAFAPGMIKGMFSTFEAPFKFGEKAAARDAANNIANELEGVIRQQRKGIPYRNIENLSSRVMKRYDDKKALATKNNVVFDPKSAMKESENEVLQEVIDLEKANLYSTGKTNVYKNRIFREPKELTPNEVLKDESKILNIKDDDRYKKNLFYRWNKPNDETTEMFKRMAAAKKINNEPWEASDLVQAGITETPVNAAKRYIGRYTEPLTSLGMNLGASTRLTDRKLGLADRYLNLPWKYGEKEQREIDFGNPEVKAYMKAYGRYKASPNYFREPPKPKGYSDEEIEKIRKATEIVTIESIFGEQ